MLRQRSLYITFTRFQKYCLKQASVQFFGTGDDVNRSRGSIMVRFSLHIALLVRFRVYTFVTMI